MRVDRHIGRIGRLGQKYSSIRIVNLHCEVTVETDVYRALRKRINLFETVVGHMQPILSKLSGRISAAVLTGHSVGPGSRLEIVNELELDAVEAAEGGGFYIDEVTDTDLDIPKRPKSTITMADLDRVIRTIELLPPGVQTRPLDKSSYSIQAPGMMEAVRTTTNTQYYEEHSESVELWSPGNPCLWGRITLRTQRRTIHIQPWQQRFPIIFFAFIFKVWRLRQ